MTEDGIREMIIQNSGRTFERCRSMNQELTFEALSSEMKKKSIAFGEAQMKTLKLIGEDGLYTNLALLLSDQCESDQLQAQGNGRLSSYVLKQH